MGLVKIINTFTIFQHIHENKDRAGAGVTDTSGSGQEREKRNVA